jgi:hypothetical protein
MAANAPRGPYKLVTVNTAPERAKVIIGRVVEAVKERYAIDYAANAESMFVRFIGSIWLCDLKCQRQIGGNEIG